MQGHRHNKEWLCFPKFISCYVWSWWLNYLEEQLMIIIISIILRNVVREKKTRNLREKKGKRGDKKQEREREGEKDAQSEEKKETRIDNDDKFVDYLTLPANGYTHTFIYMYVWTNLKHPQTHTRAYIKSNKRWWTSSVNQILFSSTIQHVIYLKWVHQAISTIIYPIPSHNKCC